MLNLNSGQVQLNSFLKKTGDLVIWFSRFRFSAGQALSRDDWMLFFWTIKNSSLPRFHHVTAVFVFCGAWRDGGTQRVHQAFRGVSVFQRSLAKTRFPLFLKCWEKSVVVFLYTCALKIVTWLRNMLQIKKCYEFIWQGQPALPCYDLWSLFPYCRWYRLPLHLMCLDWSQFRDSPRVSVLGRRTVQRGLKK